jgi:hypothetical protein
VGARRPRGDRGGADAALVGGARFRALPERPRADRARRGHAAVVDRRRDAAGRPPRPAAGAVPASGRSARSPVGRPSTTGRGGGAGRGPPRDSGNEPRHRPVGPTRVHPPRRPARPPRRPRLRGRRCQRRGHGGQARPMARRVDSLAGGSRPSGAPRVPAARARAAHPRPSLQRGRRARHRPNRRRALLRGRWPSGRRRSRTRGWSPRPARREHGGRRAGPGRGRVGAPIHAGRGDGFAGAARAAAGRLDRGAPLGPRPRPEWPQALVLETRSPLPAGTVLSMVTHAAAAGDRRGGAAARALVSLLRPPATPPRP